MLGVDMCVGEVGKERWGLGRGEGRGGGRKQSCEISDKRVLACDNKSHLLSAHEYLQSKMSAKIFMCCQDHNPKITKSQP